MKNGSICVNGNHFDYIQFGKGKKNLIMIPGLGDGLVTVKNKAFMGKLLFQPYTKDYTVTLISRKNEYDENATTFRMAAEQAAVMEALGICNAHVVGVSQGGMIAQHLAADYPDLVDRLVLVVTVPKSNGMIRENVDRWISLAEKHDFKGLMIDVNEKSHPDKILKKQRKYYPFMALMLRKPDVRRFVIQANACKNHDALEKAKTIQAPTLVIGGAEDVTLGCEGARILAQIIPGSQLVVFSGQGHALYEDEKQFHNTVLSFLQKNG